MDQRLVFNGIDAETGGYLEAPSSAEDFGSGMLSAESDPDQIAELKWRTRQKNETTFAVIEGIDPNNLAESGWGIVFPIGVDPAVQAAMAPLLDHRRAQSGSRFRILDFRPDDSKQSFLARYGAGPGPVDPVVVPYYLLLVGGPTEIPFRIQYQLEVQYAVGRITFDDAADYGAYARSVVAAETAPRARAGRATFFGTATSGDQATMRSSAELVTPLAESFAALGSRYAVDSMVGQPATKDALRKVLAEAPNLLFTATHGISFPSGHPSQREQQGALLCQDWPGVGHGALSPSDYFSASDVDPDVDLTGMLVFTFACFGVGSPALDGYRSVDHRPARRIAPEPFISALPQRMLSNPGGGALAVVGHIDRTWSYSFSWPGLGRQTAVFESSLRRLARGHSIGFALEYFSDRYAELSTDLTVELNDIRYGKVPDPLALTAMWTANNDARALTVVGDPAVMLAPVALDPIAEGLTREPESAVEVSAPPADRRDSGSELPGVLVDALSGIGTVEVVTAESDPTDDPRLRAIRARTTISLSGAVETVMAPGTAERDGLVQIHRHAVDVAAAARAELLRNLPALISALKFTEPAPNPEVDDDRSR